MKRPILLVAGLLVAAGAAFLLYFTSSLSRTTATATFSKSEDEDRRDLNELRVKAPYGYYVIDYSVVPSTRLPEETQKPFSVGGRGVGEATGLFGEYAKSTSYFSATGTIDEIPVETHVRISSNLNPAATAKIPEDKRVLSRCGIYLIVTKDRSVYEKLPSIVANWTTDAEQDAGDQAPAAVE